MDEFWGTIDYHSVFCTTVVNSVPELLATKFFCIILKYGEKSNEERISVNKFFFFLIL